MGSIRIPIAFKLALVFLIMLVVSMSIASYRTTDLFKTTSGKREEDTNRSAADAKANEVNILLDGYVNRAKTIGLFLLSQSGSDKNKGGTGQKIIFENFYSDTNMLAIRVMERGKAKPKDVGGLFNKDVLKSAKSSVRKLKFHDRKYKFPFQKVFAGNIAVANRSSKKGLRAFSIGVPLVKNNQGKVTHVALLDVKLSVIQSIFNTQDEKTMFMVDSSGEALAHKNEALLFASKKISKLPSVRRAVGSTIAKGQLRYTQGKKGRYISAFSKAKFGLVILSEAPESIILEPAQQMTHQVIYITAMVLFGAIVFIFAFSLSLTKPIETLVRATKAIAQGNFDFSVSRIVKSNDEVGSLALAFDSMLEGLQERDKVKGILNKFHGSSVAEDMISSDISTKKGSRKPVVIFFSDIRNFTATSERLAPEEVVSMLNEYFEVMVSVIIRNHGIVDKFIGDAIMAVWGAPQSTGDDNYFAVKASLEMREALEKLNVIREERGDAPIMIGMGVHTGDALSGTIGSEERMEYTVIGDTVNTASRVEASTKSFGTDLLVTQEVLDATNGRFVSREVGKAEVKGKAEPITYFKVDGYMEKGVERLIKTPYSEYESGEAGKVKIVS
jgi:adenylate cyclase